MLSISEEKMRYVIGDSSRPLLVCLALHGMACQARQDGRHVALHDLLEPEDGSNGPRSIARSQRSALRGGEPAMTTSGNSHSLV